MDSFNWAGPQRKLNDRVKHSKGASASVYINAYDYNVRALPALSYQAQLLSFNKDHFVMETVALHVVLRAPWSLETFRHSDFFQLPIVGGPKLRSPNVACAAALYRTAAHTITC